MLPPQHVDRVFRGGIDCAAIVGGAAVAWFQIWGPVLSGVSAIVAITWGLASLYFLMKRELKPRS